MPGRTARSVRPRGVHWMPPLVFLFGHSRIARPLRSVKSVRIHPRWGQTWGQDWSRSDQGFGHDPSSEGVDPQSAWLTRFAVQGVHALYIPLNFQVLES